MTATLTAATPTKLRSGAWGAKVTGTVTAGDTIRVTTRSGKSWDAVVAKVVWTNGEVAIVATESIDRPAPRPAASRCSSCRCHRERNAGHPGSILYDGCDRCGCESV